MQVTLLSTTPDAAALLIFTKNTRLEMSPGGFDAIKQWSPERQQIELAYIARTNPGSHEFVDYVFMVEGVSRAYTHQAVRTRPNTYAQQTMRVLRVSNSDKPFEYVTGPTITARRQLEATYDSAMRDINSYYNQLIEHGASIEDARGILPTNICTNICIKTNLRTLADTWRSRSGVRTQGEYREVLSRMVDAVITVHPWAEMFIKPKLSDMVANLEGLAIRARQYDVDLSNAIAKEADLLKKQAVL